MKKEEFRHRDFSAFFVSTKLGLLSLFSRLLDSRVGRTTSESPRLVTYISSFLNPRLSFDDGWVICADHFKAAIIENRKCTVIESRLPTTIIAFHDIIRIAPSVDECSGAYIYMCTEIEITLSCNERSSAFRNPRRNFENIWYTRIKNVCACVF